MRRVSLNQLRIIYVGEHHAGAAENIILKRDVVINGNIVLDLDVVADNHLVANEDILAERTALANFRAAANMHPLPDAAALADLCTFVNYSCVMYRHIISPLLNFSFSHLFLLRHRKLSIYRQTHLSSAALAESHIPWLDEMDHLTMEAVAASRQKYCQYLLR